VDFDFFGAKLQEYRAGPQNRQLRGHACFGGSGRYIGPNDLIFFKFGTRRNFCRQQISGSKSGNDVKMKGGHGLCTICCVGRMEILKIGKDPHPRAYQ